MKLLDLGALEYAEFYAYIDFYQAAPENIRVAHAIDVREVGGAICLTCLGDAPAPVFRRAVGLGVGRPATERELIDVLAYMSAQRQNYVVQSASHSQPSTLASWLKKSGFTRGNAWMKFSRPCDGTLQTSSELEIRVIGLEQGAEFGRVVTEGFDLPPTFAAWVGSLAGRPNWICVMAFSGSTPVAAGAVYVNAEYAWLGFGATLPSHRRRGAQNALLARRLSEAAVAGAQVAVIETRERLPDKPNISYANILRAGFREMYIRQNYVSP